MTTLWPSTNAIIGVYEEPPPDGAGIDVVVIDRSDLAMRDFFTAQGLKTAVAATRAKDWIAAHLP